MIVCSRCQFENPVHHRYCQECGALLVQDVASDHGPDNPIDSTSLNTTDSSTGDGMEERSPQENMVHLQNEQHTVPVLLAICTRRPGWLTQVPPTETTEQYIDRANRYRLITSDLSSVKDQVGGEVLVIDSQPSTRPYLEQGQNPAEAVPSSTSPQPKATPDVELPTLAIPLIGSNTPSKLDNPLPPNRSSLSPIPLGEANGESTPSISVPLIGESPEASSSVPIVWTLADCTTSPVPSDITTIQTYFNLQDQLYPSFPRLIDAWDDGGAVIVLENRSTLVCLKDMVGQPNVVPPQLLHWCHEMTELWEVLSNHQCCQSLLTLDNVRIDEDHILCLRRLYFDESSDQYTLKDLGQLWKTLFGKRSDAAESLACPDALVSIYQDLESNAIADLDTLRHRLEAAADQIHQNALGAVPPPHEQGEFEASGGMMQSDVPHGGIDALDDASVNQEGFLPSDSDNIEMISGNTSPSGIMGHGDDPTIVLPMQLHTLSNAGLTNIGIQRDHNEDFFAMDAQVHTTDLPSGRVCKAKGLYILCDGMGGHAAGEVASAEAGVLLQTYFQEHWTDTLPDEETIEQAIVAANQGIYEQNQADASEGSRRMGTTLVMLLVQDTKAAIAHVGDSRIYRFTRRQGLEQLTVDHEVGQREIARGVAPDVAYARPDAYQLTQALGPRDQDFIRPDIQFIDMNEDSLFILGSDGLTDNDLLETYCDSHIEDLISTNANLDEGAYQLIELANQVNGHDNITVLLVRVKLRPKLSMLHR